MKATVRYEATIMCRTRTKTEGLKITRQKSVGYMRPSAPTANPAGVCIQLFTDRIQKPDSRVPPATMQVARKWRRRPTRSMPNSMTPRKPASRKKAVSTS